MRPLALLDGAGRPPFRIGEVLRLLLRWCDEGPLVAGLLRRFWRVQGPRQALHLVQLLRVVLDLAQRPQRRGALRGAHRRLVVSTRRRRGSTDDRIDDVRRRVPRRREVALRKFGHAASSCHAAGEPAWLPAASSRRLFGVLLQDLLLAQPDVVIFAASSNLCVQFCVSTTSRLLRRRRYTRLTTSGGLASLPSVRLYDGFVASGL